MAKTQPENHLSIPLGVLRAALAVGYVIHYYTYVDCDAIRRRIAREVLRQLQLHYLGQLPDSAICSFEKRIPQAMSLVISLLSRDLVVRHDLVDLLGAKWEC